MDRLRLGLVGTGWITDLHLPALDRLGRTELIGVVSGTPERASAVAERWGGVPFESVERLLERGRPDIVFVCQPPYRTPAALELLIRAGVPFLTEKPLAAVSADAERIGALLAGMDLVTAVGYQWRALDFLPIVRDRLARRPARLVLGRWTGSTPGPAWWRHVAESGGQVIEQATHLYDLARALVGEATVLAAAADRAPRPDLPDLDIDDLAVALVRFESRAVGSFVNTSILARGLVELELIAEGERMSIRLGAGPGGQLWTLTIEDAAGTTAIDMVRDPYEVQDEAFLDAVVAGDPGAVLSTYADALRTDRLTRAVVAAAGSRG